MNRKCSGSDDDSPLEIEDKYLKELGLKLDKK